MNEEKKLTLISGGKGSLIKSKKILLTQIADNELVVYSVRNMVSQTGFKDTEEYMIATAASELATNILRYAGTGEIEINIIEEKENRRVGIELLASDRGKGIEDLSRAMQEEYSSLPNSLGLGLPCVKRIMDEFYIESIPEVGTRVLVRKWRKDEED